MEKEIAALQSRGTWELVDLSFNVDVVDCRWVFTIKYSPDVWMERYKAWLVAKGYTQTYRVDYFETFSLVLLYGDLFKDVYMQ